MRTPSGGLPECGWWRSHSLNPKPYHRCFGFDTAVQEAQRALLAAKVEASSARYGIGLVKLMGRQSGFIAMQASMASGAFQAALHRHTPCSDTWLPVCSMASGAFQTASPTNSQMYTVTVSCCMALSLPHDFHGLRCVSDRPKFQFPEIHIVTLPHPRTPPPTLSLQTHNHIHGAPLCSAAWLSVC